MVNKRGNNRSSNGIHWSRANITLRKNHDCSQSALVSAKAETVVKLVEAGQPEICMVNDRVHQGERKTKCFWDLSFDSIARSCTGPDRNECCMRCGEKNH